MPVVLGLVLLLAAAAEPSTSGSVGYYRFPAIHGDTIVFGAEGDLWQVSRTGGVAARLTSHPADEAYPAISPDGDDARLLGRVRGADRGLHDAARRRPAGAADVRRRAARGSVGFAPTARSSTRRGGTARCPTRSSSGSTSATGAAHGGAARPGGGRRLDAGRAHALLHPAPVPGQPHEALPRRHRAGPLEVRGGSGGGGAAHRRLHRDEQDADVVERPRLLPQRPGRHHERLVDGRGRPRPAPAHAPQGLGRRPGRRSPTAGSSTSWAPTCASSTSRPARTRPLDIRLSSDFDQERESWVKKPMDYLTSIAPLAEGRPRRAHRARPGVRGPREAGPPRRGDARPRACATAARRSCPTARRSSRSPTSRARSSSGGSPRTAWAGRSS